MSMVYISRMITWSLSKTKIDGIWTFRMIDSEKFFQKKTQRVSTRSNKTIWYWKTFILLGVNAWDFHIYALERFFLIRKCIQQDNNLTDFNISSILSSTHPNASTFLIGPVSCDFLWRRWVENYIYRIHFPVDHNYLLFRKPNPLERNRSISS